MSAQQITITLDPAELETLLRRVVREELERRLGRVSEDWSQEGPEDPEGDLRVLGDGLEVLEHHREDPDAWTSLEDLEREIDEAEAHGELPR